MKIKKYLCTILTIILVLSATMQVQAYTPPIEDPTVYTTVEDLYSACRAVFKEHKVGEYEFNMTDDVWSKITRWDDTYNQYFFTGNIFDFNGNQSSLPADEGDYLYHNHVGGWSAGNVNSYSKTLSVSVGDNYLITLEQEKAFDKALTALFAKGGELEYLKKANDYEKVTGCLDYIEKNVSYISSYKGLYHSAYSALCGEKKATCEGYALLFYRMLRELGIPNRILMVTSSGAHTFNIVLLDGKYYYCDATSNTALKGSKNFKPGQLQDYFQTDEFKKNVLSLISTTDYPVPHTHSYSNKYSSDKTSHWFACTGDCKSVKGKEDHKAGEWIVDAVATADKEGSKHKECTKCGYVMEKATIENLAQTEYEMLDNGKEFTYSTKGEEIKLHIAGEFQKFVNVQVDGKVIDSKYYTVKEGSTIVIFSEEYLNMLTVGKHEVIVNFQDGKAKSSIVIAETIVSEDNSTTVNDGETNDTDAPDIETEEKDTNVPADDSEKVTDSDNSNDDSEKNEDETKSDVKSEGKSSWWIIGCIVGVAISGIAAVTCFVIYKKKH